MYMERRSDDKPEKTLIYLTKECTNLALNHLVGIEMVHCSVFMATSLLGWRFAQTVPLKSFLQDQYAATLDEFQVCKALKAPTR